MADGRRLEVVVDGLSLFHGAQLAIDTTLVSVVRADGTPRPHAPGKEALPWMTRGHRKRSRIRSLLARVVVPSLSFSRQKWGGRWSTEAAQFIRALAASKMQASVAHAWCHRWRRLFEVPRIHGQQMVHHRMFLQEPHGRYDVATNVICRGRVIPSAAGGQQG